MVLFGVVLTDLRIVPHNKMYLFSTRENAELFVCKNLVDNIEEEVNTHYYKFDNNYSQICDYFNIDDEKIQTKYRKNLKVLDEISKYILEGQFLYLIEELYWIMMKKNTLTKMIIFYIFQKK